MQPRIALTRRTPVETVQAVERADLIRRAKRYCAQLEAAVPGSIPKTPIPTGALTLEIWIERNEEESFVVLVTPDGWAAYKALPESRTRLAAGSHDNTDPLIESFRRWSS